MKTLKFNVSILLTFLLLSACSPEADPVTEPEITEEEIEEEDSPDIEEEEAIDYDNILDFSAQITSPDKHNWYSYEDIFGAIFHDPDTSYTYMGKAYVAFSDDSYSIPGSQIEVTWTSDKDGIIYEGFLENDYTVEFEKRLSKAYHTLTFEARIGDNEEFIQKDSISFSNLISLTTESLDYSIRLKWTKYEEEDFQSYLIYADGERIAEIEDINTLQFLYEEVRLATPVTYQVIIKRASGILEPLHGSNLVEAEAGNYLRIPYFITGVAKSPENNLLYALVGQKNYFMDYAEDYGVLILEDSEEGIVLKDHILKNKRFSDLVVSHNGKYLFLVSRQSEFITRVDLENNEITDFFVDTFEWGLQKIDVGPDYRLYVARKSPTSGSSPMYIVDGLTGEYKGSYNHLIHGDIIFNHFNNKLYHNTTMREKSVYRLSVENDMPEREKSFSPDINYPRNLMLISDDGKHIFWDKFQLDTDLNPIREFQENILAIDLQKGYISNGKELKDFQTLETLFEYPLFPYHEEGSSIEIFNDQGDLIFFKPNHPWVDHFETVILKFDVSEVVEQ